MTVGIDFVTPVLAVNRGDFYKAFGEWCDRGYRYVENSERRYEGGGYILMALPLYMLYEICVWIAWYWERQDKKREAAAAAGGAVEGA